ncbi:hypothetical protein GRF29_106g1650122 [Pseudopithomyces chartarum]|uniref:Uncharacterized protein n=1 Tax=Pseudopithomyces chartarum TaxID=1892770 RepID=A0AAN6LT63_9PLEO|nr:hypothetical protein GRF29_106g1650122 [Pseudopithomyces chartarum]
MAPLPTNDPTTTPSPPKPANNPWNTATIIVGAVFLFLLLALIGTLIAFLLHKRSLRNKLPPSHRPRSYHPFRTETTDKTSLLSNAQSPSDDERSSMFSRERGGSVSLYVDAEPTPKRISTQSMETVNLVPLHITPARSVTFFNYSISRSIWITSPSLCKTSHLAIQASISQPDPSSKGLFTGNSAAKRP